MASTLTPPRLTELHQRLQRMRQHNPERLCASGLDDWLPLLEQLAPALPMLDRQAARWLQLRARLP